jgi:beta propeller repeat protein
MYNISSENLTTILQAVKPDIDGDNVVYIRYGVNWTSLNLYNITTRKETQIINLTLPMFSPAISGNEVVWSCSTGIFLYEIPTRRISLVSLCGITGSPDIYGDVFVWADKRDIYTYNISTGRTKQITSTGTAGDPAIYGDRIVYECAGDIYLYDISSGKTTQITKDECSWSPSIYGNKIVYVDSKTDGKKNIEAGDVYLTYL